MKEPNAPPRYGEALLNVAEKQGVVEEVLEGTRALRDIIAGQPRLLSFLDVPQISAAQKKAVLRKVLAEDVHPILLHFLCLLVDRHRADGVIEIFDAFELAWDRRRDIHPVEVRTAVPMHEDLKGRLGEKLEVMCGGVVRVTHVVDKSIIGGVVVIRGDTGTDIDGSILRGLGRLRETLSRVSIN